MTGPMLTDWVDALCGQLGVDPALIDAGAVLDLARDAAHGVDRPAAPLTTFIVGYAAALHGGGAEAIATATRQATEAVGGWPPPAG